MNKKMLPMVIILVLILFLSVSTISAANVTISQVTNSSGTVKTYVETNHTLPSNVNVSGNQVNTAQYLKLETATVVNINNKTNTTIPITTVNKPAAPSQTITTTNITKTEYINIANTVQNFININGAAPNYATQTSTGKTIPYESLVYMYSQILSSYKINGILPSYITVNPWSVVSNSTTKSFSIAQIKNASITVKSYVDKNHALPSTVNINGYNVNMYTYLYLASTSVQNVYNNNPSSVIALSYKPPEAYREDIRQGYMSKAEYIHIADVVKVYMDKTGYVPGYAYGTSLGSYFGWKSMIYMYSSILSSTTTSLPSSINVKPWRILSDPNWATFTNAQVIDAASQVKSYIETNKQLPSTITVNGKQISIYSFLYLLSFVVQNVYNHNTADVYTWSFKGPEIQKEDIHTGNIATSEYIHIADVVKVYMDKTNYVPGYATPTSLGTYFGWKSMIYMYSQILNSYKINGVLPSYITINPWSVVSNTNSIPIVNNPVLMGSTSYGYVEKAFYGNLSSSQTIVLIIGVHPLENGIHTAIYNALVSKSADLTKRYVIYMVHVTQNAADYTIGRMNGQLLAQQFIVPDVSSVNPMLVVDIHENKYQSSGYAYPRFLYPISNTLVTTAYAKQIISKMPFLVIYTPPNPTSPQYVTIPIANQGITTIIYETYLYDTLAKKESDARAFIDALDQLIK